MIISQLATSWSGSVMVAGEFERTVHVWDLTTATLLSRFDTILDFGGTRLAVTADGKNCIAAAYRVEGIAAYSTSNGAEVWRRKDLKKAQTLRVSLDDRQVYCCFDDKACHLLNRDTGETVATWVGVRNVWESPYQPIMLLEKRALVLQSPSLWKSLSIARESFGVLCVAFAPGLVCISESGGPLRCIDTETGQERWRFAETGQHVLTAALAVSEEAFVGVSWPYMHGGSLRLLRFDSESGHVSVCPPGSNRDICLLPRTSRACPRLSVLRPKHLPVARGCGARLSRRSFQGSEAFRSWSSSGHRVSRVAKGQQLTPAAPDEATERRRPSKRSGATRGRRSVRRHSSLATPVSFTVGLHMQLPFRVRSEGLHES